MEIKTFVDQGIKKIEEKIKTNDENVKSKIFKVTQNTGYSNLDNYSETGILFDKDKIEVMRKNKKINVQKWINEGNQDLTIYDVLEKYHGDLKMTQEELNVQTQELSDVFNRIKNLRDVYEIQKEATNAWDSLPLEIRREFGHDKKRFTAEGKTWVENKIKWLNEQIDKQQEESKENKE